MIDNDLRGLIELMIDGQHRLTAAIRELPAAVAAAIERQRRASRRLSPADAVVLGILLPAIDKALGTATFSVRMLAERAALSDRAGIALREALAASGSPQKIGRLLRRAAGVDIGGLRIVEIGDSREGMLRTIVTKSRKPALASDTRSK